MENLKQQHVEDFLNELHSACEDSTWCSMVLAGCFRRNIPRVIEELTIELNWNDETQQSFIENAFPMIVSYKNEMYEERQNSYYEEVRKKLAMEFIAKITNATQLHFAKPPQ